jgi:DNA-binding XRE family transcriptional regulator
MQTKLRQVREREGLSRPALSRLASVSEKTIQRAEAGDDVMSITKHKLVNALNRREERLQDYEVEEVFPENSGR